MARLPSDEIEKLRKDLSPEEDKVAFHESTERPNSSALNAETREGVFKCAVCANPLFSSEHKYDSGSGWPSFYDVYGAESLETKRDFKMLLPRTEFHCVQCGAHIGHVFKDGPEPTGKRYCANGIVLDFEPADAED